MTQELKEKVKTLEETMQDYIRHTERGFTKVNNAMVDLQNKVDDYREISSKEMQAFKNEMHASREASAREMQEFKDEMRASRETSAREMQEFKNEMAQRWGALANRLGTLAEDIVAPNIVPLARKYFNCPDQPLDFVIRRIKSHSKDRGRVREFDAYAVYDDTIVLSETKTTPRPEYLDSFAKLISEFFDFFPEYAGKKLIPIFASLNVQENILKYATKKKIYVMALKGNSMDILNYDEI